VIHSLPYRFLPNVEKVRPVPFWAR
jgi:hypothetical protein